jgi:hypothetical protein
MDNGDATNGWRDYQKLVLSELRRLDQNMEKLTERIDNAIKHERNNRMTVENATLEEVRRVALKVHGLEIRCGIFGILGGVLATLGTILVNKL